MYVTVKPEMESEAKAFPRKNSLRHAMYFNEHFEPKKNSVGELVEKFYARAFLVLGIYIYRYVYIFFLIPAMNCNSRKIKYPSLLLVVYEI